MPAAERMVKESVDVAQRDSSTRSSSAQNYLQRQFKPETPNLSTRPKTDYQRSDSTNFTKQKQQSYIQTTGLSIHGMYSSYFLNHQRAKSVASLRAHSRGAFINRSSKHATPTMVKVGDEDERPNKSFRTLLRIGMVYFGIEMIFSIEVALAVPLLLKLKVSEDIYSFVYFLSPIIGLVIQPIIGVMSDRCESRFGRRRPFVLLLCMVGFIGISLVLNANILGGLLGDKNREIPIISIILVGIGVTLLDFSADSADSPLRALILDVCNSKDQDTGLNINSFLGGTGSAFGYIVTAIDWNKILVDSIDELQLLYIFGTVVFFSTLIVSLTSVKETPIVLKEEKRPLIANHGNQILELPDELTSVENIEAEFYREVDMAHNNAEDEENDEDQPVTLKMLYLSVIKMPSELKRLMLCQLFGWLAYFSCSLFFTDFMGSRIYKGDPAAPINSTSFENYNDGVRMGSWCLLSVSLMSAFYAVIMEKVLLQRFSTRTLHFFALFIYAICVCCIYFVDSVSIIMPLYATSGLIFTTNQTLPYQLLSEYHNDKEYREKSAKGTKRGLGVDCSLLSCMFFASQSLVSIVMSLLTSKFGNSAILIVSSLCAFSCSFCAAVLVVYPEPSASPDKKAVDISITFSNVEENVALIKEF